LYLKRERQYVFEHQHSVPIANQTPNPLGSHTLARKHDESHSAVNFFLVVRISPLSQGTQYPLQKLSSSADTSVPDSAHARKHAEEGNYQQSFDNTYHPQIDFLEPNRLDPAHHPSYTARALYLLKSNKGPHTHAWWFGCAQSSGPSARASQFYVAFYEFLPTEFVRTSKALCEG
jgi:hypothetical protein